MRAWLLPIVALLLTEKAHASDEVKTLISSCAEVESIYNRRGEKHLLAGVTTSVAEAMRAGYCKGVLEQYRRTTNGCGRVDWVDQAQAIARTATDETSSINHLLRRYCAN